MKKGDRVYFMASGKDYFADEIGVLSPSQLQVEELYAGEVGYLSASIRTVADARVGDTVTHYGRKADNSLPGYEEATPMVSVAYFLLMLTNSLICVMHLRSCNSMMLHLSLNLRHRVPWDLALYVGFWAFFIWKLFSSLHYRRDLRENTI
ncbi:hypothetical protein GLYMA_04G168701v4 [Glycine max]|nr:hypothetical protein GLYMA_04G168701v4 [Glycine max]